jgi:arginine deiminase
MLIDYSRLDVEINRLQEAITEVIRLHAEHLRVNEEMIEKLRKQYKALESLRELL